MCIVTLTTLHNRTRQRGVNRLVLEVEALRVENQRLRSERNRQSRFVPFVGR